MKGLIVVPLAEPLSLPSKVISSLIKVQRSFPTCWPFYFVWNEKGKIAHNLREKITYLVENMNRARKIFLDSDFEYFLNIESHIIPPPCTISELLGAGAPVALGLYRLRKPPHPLSPWIKEPSFERFRQLNKKELTQRFVKVHRFGFGCILIKREVLEKIKFEADFQLGADFAFAKRCREEGFEVVACTKVRCQHLGKEGQIIEV